MTPLTLAAPALRDPASVAAQRAIDTAKLILLMILMFKQFATTTPSTIIAE
jgi:hypothetical protein